MYLFEFDSLESIDSMILFHTLAREGIDALILVSPDKPFISVGYFQNPLLEVDMDFCKEKGLPVFRREVGGGAVYLDYHQIFYQVVVRRDNPKAILDIQKMYEEYSRAPIETYEELGIRVSFRPVNDLITSTGKKIAGEGSADIGPCIVFVGSIILDFDYETMVRALKVPEEKFRDKIYRTMQENLTTVKRELGIYPSREEVRKILVEKFEKIFGKFERGVITDELREKMNNLRRYMLSPSFLFKRTMRLPDKVKIREGVEIIYGLHKARGGLIRTVEEVRNEIMEAVSITGDFSMFPKKGIVELENELQGKKRDKEEVKEHVIKVYEKEKIQTPGVEVDDYIKALKLEEDNGG